MTSPLPDDTLRLGLPSGSMQASTFELFDRAGWHVRARDRSVFPSIDDREMSCVLFRAQEMSRYVVDGLIDCGLTGHDWIVENGNENDVIELCELTYSRATSTAAKWVLAVPNESSVRTPEDLAGGIVATEIVNVVRRYFASKSVECRVEFSWGTTEIKARICDAIVDLTETGSSIRANNLRVIDTLLTSNIRFVANKRAWDVPWKREKMENLAILLKGAMAARGKVGLKLNVAEDKLAGVVDILPALKSPTVNKLYDGDYAVEVIIDESLEREIIPKLKRMGATEIFSYPLNKVIP